MTLAEKIYQKSRALPEDAAREALDFIEFLAERYGAKESAMASEATLDEESRQKALDYLATLRIDWGGKPIPDRDELYDEARD